MDKYELVRFTDNDFELDEKQTVAKNATVQMEQKSTCAESALSSFR